jgi:hypothetical protein
MRKFLIAFAFVVIFAAGSFAQTNDGSNSATFTIDLASSSVDFAGDEFNPPPPDVEETRKTLGLKAENASKRESISLQSFAPDPEGQNLAPLAAPSASSHWPWPVNGLWETPDKAIDGNMGTFWASTIGDGSNAWYRLDWPQPITMGRIYLTDGLNVRGHTVHSISYFDLTSNSWVILPNSSFTYGPPYPSSVDFRCSPVQTNAIILRIRVGPANPHPNGAVTITEIEVYSDSLEIKSLIAVPDKLLLDQNGVGQVLLSRR